jgi:NADPH-dependent 2,4-dienoyl-CoA reductase/sulfur reductase-like enzyme
VLAKGIADLVSMNRAIMADPELPKKAQEGRLAEIRHCIGGNECRGRLQAFLPVACAMNPELGREQEMALVPVQTPKRVMIVGGGPAGLEAARVAALRGHQVSLYEKGEQLGGQTLLAARAPSREDFREVHRYYTYQMQLLGVEVHLHTEVTAEMIIGTAPDAVVIATGSRPLTPDIPRTSDAQVVDVWAVLAGEVRVHSGQRVVVIAGEHHIQALSTADVLAEKGCQVAVLTEALHAGAQLEGGTLELIYGRLLKKGVVITPLTAVKAIKSHGITTENVLTKQESGLEGVDMVVVAYGGQADDALYRAVKGQVDEVDLVGDAWAPRRLIDAIQDGARVGRRV